MPKTDQVHIGKGMTPSRTELGKLLRKRRIEKGLSQTSLARQTGINQNLISRWEIGTREYIKDSHLKILADSLHLDLDVLRSLLPKKWRGQPKNPLGELIHSRREEIGMPIETFAKKMGLTPKTARAFELRPDETVNCKQARLLVEILGISPSALTVFVKVALKPTKSRLGQLIRAQRQKLLLDLGTLSAKVGISIQHLNQIESGQNPLCDSDDLVRKLAKALEIGAAELFRERLSRRTRSRPHPLGEFLTKERHRKGLTQKQLAQIICESRSRIFSIENGAVSADEKLLQKMGKALGCQIPKRFISGPDRSLGNADNRVLS